MNMLLQPHVRVYNTLSRPTKFINLQFLLLLLIFCSCVCTVFLLLLATVSFT